MATRTLGDGKLVESAIRELAEEVGMECVDVFDVLVGIGENMAAVGGSKLARLARASKLEGSIVGGARWHEGVGIVDGGLGRWRD